MDSKLHEELVYIRRENFQPAKELLLAGGVPLQQIEKGDNKTDVTPYVAAFETALEIPLWPFNQARIIHAMSQKSGISASWPVLKRLLYRDWTVPQSQSEPTATVKLAMGRVQTVRDTIAGAMGMYALKMHKADVFELVRDERLGDERVAFVPAIRRLFGMDARPILEALKNDPRFAVEATHQLKILAKKEAAK
jgi:hypothetical protein